MDRGHQSFGKLTSTTQRSVVVSLIALCGFVSSGFVVADTASPAFSLRISVADGRIEVLPLLPVCVTVEIANTGSTPIEVPSLVPDVLPQGRADAAAESQSAPQSTADGPLYVFVIGRPDGTEVEAAYADHTAIVSSSADRQRAIPPTVSLGPGESLARDFCLGYGRMVSENTTATPLTDEICQPCLILSLSRLRYGCSRVAHCSEHVTRLTTGKENPKKRLTDF